MIDKYNMRCIALITMVTGFGFMAMAAKNVMVAKDDPGDIESLRAAINNLADTFGSKYPKDEEYLERLEKIQDSNSREFLDLQKEALIANPLVSGQPVLYISRRQYPGGHHNTETMFQSDEQNAGKYNSIVGGSMKSVDLAKGGEVTTIVPAGAAECVRDPELSY